jgi:hypothetical protein
MLVDRALDEVIVAGPRPALLEPLTSDALSGAIESAVRRTDTVCVLGGDARVMLEAALALYPSRRGCVLPLTGGDDGLVLAADVDLEQVGRELGAAARAVAGDGGVLVLDGRDGMLDRRWATGVLAGSLTANHVVTSATELLQLLDDQAAAMAAGIIPGSIEALGGPDQGAAAEFPDRDDVPIALVLPPVEVVVLDASAEAELALAELLERGVRVIAPRSLLVDSADHPAVVLRWRVRWDLPLAALLRRVLEGSAGNGAVTGAQDSAPAWSTDEVLVLEAGPAAPRG